MFRDENEKVVTKARIPKPKPEQRRRARIPGSSSSRSESGSPPSSHSQTVTRLSLPPPSSALPVLQDEGIRFFFNHYVTVGALRPRTDQAILSSPMFPLIYRSESFCNAVSSVGYAGLSNVTKDPEHMIIARKKYATSIRNITRALEDVANSDLDATFKSVMLLAAFEVSQRAPSFRKRY